MATSYIDGAVLSAFRYSVALTSNMDMDNIKTPGIYRCNGSTAATLSHCPVSSAFVMLVLARSNQGERNQILFSASNIAIRETSSESFVNQSWTKFTGTTS